MWWCGAGSRKAPVIGDHMPPNKLLQGSKDQMSKWVGELPVIGKVRLTQDLAHLATHSSTGPSGTPLAATWPHRLWQQQQSKYWHKRSACAGNQHLCCYNSHTQRCPLPAACHYQPPTMFCYHCCLIQQWPVQVAEVLGGGRGKRGPAQRFYPQCQRCSIKQASAVRNGKRVLVLHLHWPRRGRGEHLSGESGGTWGSC